jgi:hypothetical protein
MSFSLIWRHAPRGRWQPVLCRDLGFRDNADEPFRVETLAKAEQAVATLRERAPASCHIEICLDLDN